MSNSVTLIGGEDLPKVSTQALKQQYEKSIEEATPAKEIKVMMPSVYLNRCCFFFFLFSQSMSYLYEDEVTSGNNQKEIVHAMS